MSNAFDFQGDAMECLRMADRATGPEEKSVLQSLARAWMMLGDQVKHLHDESVPDGVSAKILN